jgi:hypothetical protein
MQFSLSFVTSIEPRFVPESNIENCSSDIPGNGEGISTIFGCDGGPGTGTGTVDATTTSSFTGSDDVYPSRFVFIIPHVTSMKTIVWSTRPPVDGHPVGLETHDPNTLRITRNVSGFATTKKTNADIMEIRNFCSCFLPSHPQPQSLKRPIGIFYIHCIKKKKRLKV